MDEDLDLALVPRRVNGERYPTEDTIREVEVLRLERATHDHRSFVALLQMVTDLLTSVLRSTSEEDSVFLVGTQAYAIDEAFESLRPREELANLGASIRSLVAFVDAGSLAGAELVILGEKARAFESDWATPVTQKDGIETMAYLCVMSALEVRADEWVRRKIVKKGARA